MDNSVFIIIWDDDKKIATFKYIGAVMDEMDLKAFDMFLAYHGLRYTILDVPPQDTTLFVKIDNVVALRFSILDVVNIIIIGE